ncbi:MAG: shikimate dehydrogenase [Elusimicrobiota bacterium]
MIAIPITAPTVREAAEDIRYAGKTDILELRLDLIEDINDSGLKELLRLTENKVIVTDRKQRRNLIELAIEHEADFIDMDITMGKDIIREISGIMKKTRSIVSYHDFEKTDEKIISTVYEQISGLNPHIIKIVSFANSIADNRVIFDLIARARNDSNRIIALCMGEKGIISRILATFLGAELTFGSLREGRESAPGQITAEMLKNLYGVGNLRSPSIFGLVGNPVAHSRGTYVHNRAFRELGLENIYVNFLVDDLGVFMDKYRDMISGLSVTIPFKQEIMKYVDSVEPDAAKIGAVNTVVKNGNVLTGCNTDMAGAIDAIKEKQDIAGKNVAIIGAGGAARAIAYGIIKESGNLTVINRTVEKAEKLAGELGCRYGDFDSMDSLKDIDLLINATSIGMHPDVDRTPVAREKLKKLAGADCVVFDSVYNPAKTRLLKDAAELGLETVTGEKMFLNQAARQFRLFTGREMP